MPSRLLLPLASLLLAVSTAQANETITLQAVQAKALGIATLPVGQDGDARLGRQPARVTVPNEQMRVVAAPVGGLVEWLGVAPGSTVRRGQTLARLASPEALGLQRDALQADSQSALLQRNLKRDEQLFGEGLIAESRLQATRAAAEQAAAQAGERRQSLALAGIAPGRLGGAVAVAAPIDGVVIEQGAQVGQRVEMTAPLYKIAKLSPLWLEIQAPLAAAAGLRAGMPVRVAEPEVLGKLIAVGRAVDPASQSVLLRAAVDKGAEKLTPGQVVEVEIPGPPDGGQRLPAAAVIRDGGQASVFVEMASEGKAADGNESDRQALRFEARPVRILGQSGDSVVAAGVAPGERIAVKGVSALKAILTGVGKN